MKDLNEEDCFFLKQMLDPEIRLRESMPQMSDYKPFTDEAKRGSIDKLLECKLLAGHIPKGTNNYADISITDCGHRFLSKMKLMGKCND